MYNSENWKDYSDSSQILMSFPSSYIAKETFKKGLKQNKFKMRHETDAANIKPVIRDYVSLCYNIFVQLEKQIKELQLTYTTSKTDVK